MCASVKAAEPPTAAQHRMIGAEANRLAEPLAASEQCRHARIRPAKSFKPETANRPFSWGSRGIFSFEKRIPLSRTPHSAGEIKKQPFRAAKSPRAGGAKKKEHPAGALFSLSQEPNDTFPAELVRVSHTTSPSRPCSGKTAPPSSRWTDSRARPSRSQASSRRRSRSRRRASPPAQRRCGPRRPCR